MSKRYSVLHIADPHFSRCHFTGDPTSVGQRHAQEIKEVLTSKGRYDLGRKFDILLLSGDFTWASGSDGFTAAIAFVHELSTIIKSLGTIVLPGNHDIALGDPVVIGKLSLPTPKEEAEANFRDFLKALEPIVPPPNDHLSVIHRVPLDEGLPGVVLIGLNSCRVERRDAQGWGYVGADQIYSVGTALRDFLEPASAKPNDLVIAAMHHNPLPIWDLGLDTLMRVPEARKFSFLMDAGSVLGFLADIRVGIILHGHTHILSEKRVEGYGQQMDYKRPKLQSMVVLGTGSLGVEAGLVPVPHHFGVLEIDWSKLSGQSPTITRVDFSSFSTPRNSKRAWTVTRKIVNAYNLWDPFVVSAALQKHEAAAGTAQRDYLVSQSWSVLRLRKHPSEWPNIIRDVVARVQQIDPKLGFANIVNAVESLFNDPPSEFDISNWYLEEFLIRRLTK